MHVFISGITGSGLSSLAHFCLDLGYIVSGSDVEKNHISQDLIDRGVNFYLNQSAQNINTAYQLAPIDIYIYSPAISDDNPEKTEAKIKYQIPSGRQNFLVNQILEIEKMKLIAVSGTHGKTTTSAMLVWLFKQLNVPISYMIGSELPFGRSGSYEKGSSYFIYEADEYDRKFLDLNPYLSIIPNFDFDHPDTYKNKSEYAYAFLTFITQNQKWVYMYKEMVFNKLLQPAKSPSQLDQKYIQEISNKTFVIDNDSLTNNHIDHFIKLSGKHYRENAFLVLQLVFDLYSHSELKHNEYTIDFQNPTETGKFKEFLSQLLNKFPGVSRRFEKLAPGYFSDYAHHPTEIKATLQLARELTISNNLYNNVVVVYQPHQNLRQYEIRNDYSDCFQEANIVYWVDTYLSRENPNLRILKPSELVTSVKNKEIISFAQLNSELAIKLKRHLLTGDMVILMGAGSIDDWGRKLI